jgi:hypothetical protein
MLGDQKLQALITETVKNYLFLDSNRVLDSKSFKDRKINYNNPNYIFLGKVCFIFQVLSTQFVSSQVLHILTCDWPRKMN